MQVYRMFYSSLCKKSSGREKSRVRTGVERKKQKKAKRTQLNAKNGLYIPAKFGMM